MQQARRHFESLGYRVTAPDDPQRSRGYLAGEDSLRAAELMAALTDPEVDAVFAIRGGYGVTRILDRLDYHAIRGNPKVVLGYSDITALHLALAAKTGLITFHGPVAVEWSGDAPVDPVSDAFFWRAVSGRRGEDATEPARGYTIGAENGVQLDALHPGVARGRLVGGNLTLINTLMGTPYEIDTRDAVLLIEDVGEKPYRIDRYLSQLRLAGKLDQLSAVIVGHFNDCDPDPEKPSLTLEQIFDDYLVSLDIPVITGFPAGHDFPNITLPLGAMVDVDADRRRITILEDPVRPKR